MSRRARLAATTVVLALVPSLAFASTAGKPVKGAHYVGYIGPGYLLQLKVSADGKTVEHLGVAFEATCEGSPGDSPPTFHFKALAIKSGRFAGTTRLDSGPTVSEKLKVTGSFSGRKVSGSATDTLTIKSLGSCSQKEAYTGKVGALKKIPNACKTFTLRSADKLFAVSPGRHLSEKETQLGTPVTDRTCNVTRGKSTLAVTTTRSTGTTPVSPTCYKRSKLGAGGQICVLTAEATTTATFTRHGINYFDSYDVALPSKGKRLYTFALAQHP